MQNHHAKETLKKMYARYDQMMEKQGFYIVLAVCVLVIVASAFYTFSLRDQAENTTQWQQIDTVEAGGTQDAQTLQQALVESQQTSSAVQVPSESDFVFALPVDGIVDRLFSDTNPQFFAQSNAWQLHLGVDLQVDYGTIVSACASGEVVAVWEDNQKGLCIRIAHDQGYESVYAGLSDASYVRAGDEVMVGQTIGHSGNGVLDESDAEPHLHLEVYRNGQAIDPMLVFLGIDTE